MGNAAATTHINGAETIGQQVFPASFRYLLRFMNFISCILYRDLCDWTIVRIF